MAIRRIITIDDSGGQEILSQVCRLVTVEEREQVVQDLLDTAKANESSCASLNANQIGLPVTACVIKTAIGFVPFVNPRMVSHSSEVKQSSEFCVSIPVKDPTKRRKATRKRRYKWVKVETDTGVYVARNWLESICIQHAFDHFAGRII